MSTEDNTRIEQTLKKILDNRDLFPSEPTISIVKMVEWYDKYLVFGFIKVCSQINQKPTRLEFQGDLQVIMMVAITMYHFQERIPKEFKLSREDIISECLDYALLGDAVDAWKHGAIDAFRHRRVRILTRSEQICETIIVDWNDDLKVTNKVYKSIYLSCDDGVQRDFLEVLANVLSFWEKHLHSCGIIQTCRRFSNKIRL